MSKHTPGPWTTGHLGTNALWVGPSHNEVPVAIVPWDTKEARDNAKENARFLAHAPTLLAAFKKLMGPADDPNIGWRGVGTSELFACEFCGAKHTDTTKIQHGISCPIPSARAAISKAEGA